LQFYEAADVWRELVFRKEWLIDYEKREEELFNRFLKDLKTEKIDENAQYPPARAWSTTAALTLKG